MTSQIAIFNSLGVGIASDTVTTLQNGRSTKTTSNAERVCPMGPGHLVAVLHSGEISKNNVNSRLLISEWQRTVIDPLPHLAAYATSFSARLGA